MDWTTLAAVATALIAIYAAALSTYTYIMNRRDRRPLIKVNLSYGLAASKTATAYLLVNVSNPGQRPVAVTSIGFQLPDKRQIPYMQGFGDGVQTATRLPFTCDPGSNALFAFPPRMVAETLTHNEVSGDIRLRAFADEATGTRYFSKWKDYNTNKLMDL